MTKQKTTKKALLASVFSLVLSVSMLVGSTFAWFTDSARTGVTIIKSGKLDVMLEMSYDGGETWEDAEGKPLEFRDVDGNAAVLWEPGSEFKLPQFRVRNNGNLAFKFKIIISELKGKIELADVLDVNLAVNGGAKTTVGTLKEVMVMNDSEIDGMVHGTLTAGAISDAYEVSLRMQDKISNDYQDLTLEGLCITVYAAQTTEELDSYGNQYDNNAMYDVTDVWDGTVGTLSDDLLINTAREFAAFAASVNSGETYEGKTVTLNLNIDLDKKQWTSINNFAGTFNGQGYTISNIKDAALFGTVSGTVKNLNVKNVNVLNTGYNGKNGFIGTLATGGLVDNCKVSGVKIEWSDTVTDCGNGFGGVISGVQAGATVQDCDFTDISMTTHGKTKNMGAVFSSIVGTVKDCNFADVNFTVSVQNGSNAYVTSQCGGFASSVGTGAVVENCEIDNMQVNVYRGGHLGGIFGKAYGATLKDITVNGLTMNVGNTEKSITCVAGFIAQPDSRSNDVRATIDNCHIYDLDMTLASSKQGESAAAGFISGLCGGVDITNCSVSGKIDATNTPANVGGFVGDAGWYGKIEQNFTDCVANVDITVKDSIGGGFIAVDGILSSGGVYGGTATLNFNNCQATGTVTVVEGGTGTVDKFCGKTVE